MFCQNCGNQFEGRFCPTCGFDNDSAQATNTPTTNTSPSQANGVRCPRCGSPNLQVVSDVKGEGAKLWKLCLCGFLGLCGAGKTTTTHYWVCNSCGNKFKV